MQSTCLGANTTQVYMYIVLNSGGTGMVYDYWQDWSVGKTPNGPIDQGRGNAINSDEAFNAYSQISGPPYKVDTSGSQWDSGSGGNVGWFCYAFNNTTIDGYHVDMNGNPLPGGWALAFVDQTSDGGWTFSGNNPYGFNVPAGTRQHSAAVWAPGNPYFPGGSAPPNLQLVGYTWCYEGNLGGTNCGQLGNPATITPGSSASVGLFAGMTAHFRWWYKQGQISCTMSAPSSVAPGATFSASVTEQNKTGSTWPANSNYNLGSSNPRDNQTWKPLSPGVGANNYNRAGTVNVPTPDGASFTFNFTATAPNSPGTYSFSWEMVHDGVAWLGGLCSQNIKVQAQPAKHPIYSGNVMNILSSFVRDNFKFGFNVGAYLWPDAGLRGCGGNGPRMWLAGVYGQACGDTGGDGSVNADPNNISSTNKTAESNCPQGNSGTCLGRVPLSYVPQADVTGDSTPNGNNWLSIKNRAFGAWDPFLGGIASTQNNNVGGFTGTHLNNVETSNIRVEAVGIKDCIQNDGDGAKCVNAQGSTTQGGPEGVQRQVPTDSANASDRGLPPSSQGPTLPPGGTAGPGKTDTWDNVRNPSKGGGFNTSCSGTYDMCDQTTRNTIDYANPVGGTCGGQTLPQFNCDPNNMGSIFANFSQVYAQGFSVSLLQDGNDAQGYKNGSEPLSLTNAVDNVANTHLKWDEYADWTQVDDKGHYATTRNVVPTGAYYGGATNANYVYQYFDAGYPQIIGYNSGCSPNWYPPGSCTPYSYPIYSTCDGYYTYRTDSYASTTVSWNDPLRDSQFGWLNTKKGSPGSIPYRGPGGTAASYFAPNPQANPSWSQYDNLWQPKSGNGENDTSAFATPMDNSGATTKPFHQDYWQLDRGGYPFGDPAYTDRYLFNQGRSSQPFIYTYSMNTSASCKYPNGAGIYSTTSYPITYYPSYGPLYENSNTPGNTNQAFGQCASGCPNGSATHDGNSDGMVDVGWQWISNIRRVRYENTYAGHYRDLGPRSRTGSDAADNLLYGLDGQPNASNFSRAMSWISNPVINTAYADVFGAAGIDRYFSGSGRSSAFLFSNGLIDRPQSGIDFQRYCINPDQPKVNSYFPTGDTGVTVGCPPGGDASEGNDAVNRVFSNFSTMLKNVNQTFAGGTTLPANFPLNGGIYHVTGDLTINGTTFCTSGNTTGNPANISGTGGGTFIVDGSLFINGTGVSYCNYGGNDRTQLPSVGFIVRACTATPCTSPTPSISPRSKGIFVGSGVTKLFGSYFTNGQFDTGSVLDPNGANRTGSDVAFQLQGLAVARQFQLRRQTPTAGANICAILQLANCPNPTDPGASTSESFQYDGRVVVAPPPGFSAVLQAPAVWNEAVPFN